MRSLVQYIERSLPKEPMFDADKVSVWKDRYLMHARLVNTVFHRGIAMSWPVCTASLVQGHGCRRDREKLKMDYVEFIELYSPSDTGGVPYCVMKRCPIATVDGVADAGIRFWKSHLYATAMDNSLTAGIEKCVDHGIFYGSHPTIEAFVKDGACR